MKRPRAMTLIELMVVMVIAGTLASVGMFSMVDIVSAERARNEAVRFATQVRRQRAEAMQQQMYTLVSLAPDSAGTGTKVSFAARRIGTDTITPCEVMAAGTADVVRTSSFSAIKVELSTTAQPTATRLCLDPYGKPMTMGLSITPAEFTVTHEGEPKLNLTIDALGALASTDQPVASGIAQTSFFPLDLMLPESAPVPPNMEDVPELPVYEVAPGEYVDADGTPTSDGALGGTDDPCLYDATYCITCGNGVIEGTEQCDDANFLDGDGCDSTCTFSSGIIP